MTRLSRRRVLKGAVLAPLGVYATTRATQPAIAASGWADTTIEHPSTDGTLNAITLSESDLSFDFTWSNFPSGGDDVDITLEARLGGAAEYETVFTGQFSVTSESGDSKPITGADITLSTGSFPVDLLAATSMTSSDFAVPDGDNSKETPIDFRITFEQDSSTATSTATCYVTVVKDTLIDGFEAGNLDAYAVANDGGTINVTDTRPLTDTYSLEIVTDSAGSHEAIRSNTTELSEAIQRGGVYRVYFYRGSEDSRGRFIVNFGQQDSNNKYQVYTHFDLNDTAIRKVSGGSISKSSNAGVSPPRTSWEWVEFDWDSAGDGTITLDTSWTSTTVTISDTEWGSGDYEIRAQCASNVTTWVDDIDQVA